MNESISDPIFERDGKWYHWDEVWAYEYGPYDTRDLAEEALKAYCRWLDSPEYPNVFPKNDPIV